MTEDGNLQQPISGMAFWAIVVAAILAVLVMASAFIYAPYYSFAQIQTAADQGDKERFDAFVDVEAVRGALTAEIRAAITAQMGATKASPQMLDIVETHYIRPMVARSISAENMMHLLTGTAPPAGTRRTAQIDDVINGRDGLPSVQQGYDGLNRFIVRAKDANSKTEILFVLLRDGLGWRLDEVRIPTLVDELKRQSQMGQSPQLSNGAADVAVPSPLKSLGPANAQ